MVAHITDLHALYPHLLSLLPSHVLARVACVCGELRAAASCDLVWREAFAVSYGQHGAAWAETHEPVRPGAAPWRTRCELRARAAAGRRAGRCHSRTLPFELGYTPEDSEFFVSVHDMDGCWLVLGEYSGRISLWDLRSGRRQWRVEGAVAAIDPNTTDPHACFVDGLHLDAVSGLLTCINSKLGHARVYRMADGQLLLTLPHYPSVQLAGGDETPPLTERLLRCRLYSGERLGDASLPLRLMTLCDLTEDEDDDEDAPPPEWPPRAKPLGLIWKLDALGDALAGRVPWSTDEAMVPHVPLCTDVPTEVAHAAEGMFSEQAGMLAKVTLWDEGDGHQLHLCDVHSLRGLGHAPLPPLQGLQMVSLQRRGGHDGEWWLLVEGTDELVVIRLRLRRTLAEVRAGAEGSIYLPEALRRVSLHGVINPGEATPELRRQQLDWWSFDNYRWHVIARTTPRQRRFAGTLGGLFETSHGAIELVDLASGCALSEPLDCTNSGLIDLRGEWAPLGGGGFEVRPSALLQLHSDEWPLMVWDGSGGELTEVRSTPASAMLRELSLPNRPEYTSLSFVKHHSPEMEQVLADDGQDVEPLSCVSNWRFVVVVDARGVHVLDWLPRAHKTTADGGRARPVRRNK